MKKFKPYLLNISIVLLILIPIFIYKGIYPFGDNSLINGDMHDQITAFYHNFYDVFKSNNSLFITFSASSGVNFFGILAYYILSPFSFLVLLVKRDEIFLVVSVIIALKILLSSLTCQIFIRKYFKNIPTLLSVLLAIVYAFSGYSLMMYQITSWIDVMYLFPLVMIGLKKVLDLEKPTFYIIALTFSLIFDFYVSVMAIMFIFLAAFIYLIVYKDSKEVRMKSILALGISTVISVLLSLFIIIPSYMQISISSRIGLYFDDLLNSRTGPITDKASMFLFGGVVYVGLFLLIKNYKKNFKFLTFYIPTLLLVLIPVVIEPINKMWHFGSYAFFPYRFGFITMFLLVLGACYAFNKYECMKEIVLKKNKVISIGLTLIIAASIFVIMYSNYNDFQRTISHLTISTNRLMLLVLVLSTFAAFIGCLIIIFLNKKLNKFSLVLISIITVTHILVNTATYIGFDYCQEELSSQYLLLNEIEKDYEDGDYYRVKNELDDMIMNSSLVMKYHSLDHFSSLSDGNTLNSLKKMGYSSFWVMSSSRGGNLFLDNILANKYIITEEDIDDKYYELVKKYGEAKLYSLKETPSYGYLINNNDSIFDKKNSFEISNSMYKNITSSDDNLFEIVDDFKLDNIDVSSFNDNKYYKIIDDELYAYFETDIDIEGEKTLYLELLRSLVNNDNQVIYENFNIYINDELYIDKALKERDNGVINLGIYNNEKVNIKIELIKSVDLNNITIGIMDNSKYDEFVKNQKIDTNIKYNRNKIDVQVNTEDEKILFLPISYNEGYKATNNGREVEVLKLYDNFIGIKLDKGENSIHLSFIPKGFIPCLIISFITLIFSIVLIKTNLYHKILDFKLLQNIAYYVYLAVYFGIILIIYIGLTVCFIISYFVPFS